MPPPAISADSPVFPFELIREDLQRVEAEIARQARAFDPAVEGYVSYLCQASGKRIRPALAMLAGGATGGKTEDHTRLAVVLELVHMASLVHDDIMDGAEMRRGLPTAASKWGPSLSVLLGDAMFAYALELATDFEDSQVCRQIAQASREVCSGEILQTQRRFDFSLSVADYRRMIEMKTAALFAAASGLGARLNGVTQEVEDALRGFGLKLGTVYQIYDDCLDLVGDERKVGKTLGTDLQRGKLTLPVLFLLQATSEVRRQELQEMLLQGESIEPSQLSGVAGYSAAVDQAIAYALELLDSADEDLGCLLPSADGEALSQVCDYLRGLLKACGRPV
jgi:octaprenyl-diphosphate synthase